MYFTFAMTWGVGPGLLTFFWRNDSYKTPTYITISMTVMTHLAPNIIIVPAPYRAYASTLPRKHVWSLTRRLGVSLTLRRLARSRRLSYGFGDKCTASETIARLRKLLYDPGVTLQCGDYICTVLEIIVSALS